MRPQHEASTGHERIASADALRVCAIAMVVVLHSAASLLYDFSRIPPSWWWTANVIDSLVRPCVPLFVMVSGMLLLEPRREESLRMFAEKRAKRVLLPLLSWSLVYWGWNTYAHHISSSLGAFGAALIRGSVYYHLGFLYMLLGLYLATPILRIYVRHASPANIKYFLLLWFGAASAAPLCLRFLHVEVGLQFVVATGFVGYFLLGHVLREKVLTRRQAIGALGILTAFTAATAIGTYFLTVRAGGNLDETFFDYLSPNVVAMSLAVFMLVKSLPHKSSALVESSISNRAVRRLSLLSFGIYLVHPIVLEVLSSRTLGLNLSASSIHPLFGIPITAAATLAISAVVVMLLGCIPLLRQLLVPN
jgi:surface polysaccharide O-acyltransferase-like enzyme